MFAINVIINQYYYIRIYFSFLFLNGIVALFKIRLLKSGDNLLSNVMCYVFCGHLSLRFKAARRAECSPTFMQESRGKGLGMENGTYE